MKQTEELLVEELSLAEKKLKEVWHKRFDRDKKDWNKVDLKDKPLDGHIVGYYTKNEDGTEEHHPVGEAFGFSFWSQFLMALLSALSDWFPDIKIATAFSNSASVLLS